MRSTQSKPHTTVPSWLVDVVLKASKSYMSIVNESIWIHLFEHKKLQWQLHVEKIDIWLVVFSNPSEKWWSSSIGMIIASQYWWENAKLMSTKPPTRLVIAGCFYGILWDFPLQKPTILGYPHFRKPPSPHFKVDISSSFPTWDSECTPRSRNRTKPHGSGELAPVLVGMMQLHLRKMFFLVADG